MSRIIESIKLVYFGKDAVFCALGSSYCAMEASLSNPSGRRIALYARCSTSRDQSTDAQLRELHNYCAARGWKVVEEIVDHGFSGMTDKRPGFKRLMQLSRERKVDVVITLKLDRLFRSLKHLILTLQEFEELSIEFISTKDQIDLSTSAGRLMMHIVGAFAQFERDIIVARTMVGLEHARSKGIRLGRPQRSDRDQILKLRAQGLSYRKICKTLGCSFGAINNAVKAALKSGSDLGNSPEVTTGVYRPK